MGPCSLFHNLFPEAVYRSFSPLPAPSYEAWREPGWILFEQSMRVAKIFFLEFMCWIVKGGILSF